MEKIKSGIKGFDHLLNGGIPKGKTILLSGSPGTGKTIFSLQFLYAGAKLYGEKCLYISFEEDIKNLISQAKHFGWDLAKLQKQKKLFLMYLKSSDIDRNTASEIIKIVRNKKITRLVIDSLSTLAFSISPFYSQRQEITEITIRRFIYHFINELNSLSETTTILISQTKDGELSGEGVSEFLCDGIINIVYESLGGAYSRTLRIRKMREVKNNEDIHPLEISKTGIKIHSLD